MGFGERFMVRAGEGFDFEQVDPDDSQGLGRDEADDRRRDLRDVIISRQYDLWAEGKRALLIVLQGMDCAGKDSTIRRVFSGVNPTGIRVTSFKEPTDEELAHDFLWRIHAKTPARGKIAIFNRSQYEDVLIVRVENLVEEAVWRTRYERINEFERNLVESGTTVLKFCLVISEKEQRDRLISRLRSDRKNWKFKTEDVRKHQQWNEYVDAYEDAISETSTEHAPWYVIPAGQKWYRDYIVTRIVAETLDEMDPKPPPLRVDPEQMIRILRSEAE